MTDLAALYEAALAEHSQLEKRLAKEEAAQEAARQRLAQLMAQAKAEFGVTSLQELSQLYQTQKAENETKMQAFVDAMSTFKANLLAAETAIAGIKGA